jgi:hypothetical protein
MTDSPGETPMPSAKDHLRLLIDRVTDEEADKLLDAAEQLCLVHNADLVTKSCACPSCGERRIDELEWTTDECVVCLTCGTTYDPNGKGPLNA